MIGLNRGFEPALADLERSVDKILFYTEGMNFDDFIEDEKAVDAVLWNFQVMGEVVSNIPGEFRKEHSRIEWGEIRDFRNVVNHKYWMVDPEIIRDIVENKLPDLSDRIDNLSV